MSFEDFILKQMKRASISQKEGKKIFAKYSSIFVTAFTHKSHDPVNNYEMLEASGDRVLNAALFDILWKKYPKLDQGTITSAFQKAKSEEILSLEGKREGFFKHIIMSEEYRKDVINWRDNSKKSDFVPLDGVGKENKYIKLFEDTVESFCGALHKAVNLYSDSNFGVGSEMVYNWAMPLVDNLPFDPTDRRQTFNIQQQLKEFWDTVFAQEVNEGKKITNYLMYFFDKKSKPGQKIIYATVPDPSKRKRDIIVRTVASDDKKARYEAAKLAYPIVVKKFQKEFQKGLEYKNEMRKQNSINK